MEKKKKATYPTSDDSESNLWSFLTQRGTTASFVCITLFAILVRVAVSIHPYSGAGTPPKYGDYEAQRHWMEITLNLPVKEWYQNSTVNDLKYWGLDYPPLTAYQSYIHGLFLRYFDPQSVELFTSRGYESYIGKLLMRWTVLLSDVLIFFPAVIYFVTVYYSGTHDGPKSGNMWHFAMILLNPCLILIDHGHFQYNCISLGFTVAAVSAILSDRDIFGSILFTLALNHKQMSAYFAPAFFGYLFGKCLRRQNPFLEVLKLGLAVLGTFIVLWWPYLYSLEAPLEVLSRLAPFERGIYEDYVANFWCTTSVIVKWKRLFSTQALRMLSLVSTVSTCLPSMLLLILAPSRRNFLFGLLSSALSFYFFSFQVHEKSILLPLLPASFLAIDEPLIFRWLTYFALLSMFPLLRRDELILPYIALYGLFVLLYNAPVQRKDIRETRSRFTTLKYFLIACSILLHIVYLMVTPPRRYPFLSEAVMMLLCFSQFFFIFMYTNMKQWQFLKFSSQTVGEKKNI
ncbi:probable dolichyl pyrophosphate Man9GlcNAc2 alpha-1,3-glucosyltransferase isoform X1 [Nicotiana tomentosiformis]|uniref:Alpha-1,3-glucosyltransferase n=1 Tax=Nicotiana tabacum TaxID=4097 RepID=A0A1S4BL64_TOBAC|nr:probable dolichyl pyrophosphate Man9GlcNAc2 alpha-1,3-glucosyltransferase [Nicotiana tomentosiformis]XP_016489609.1 PREDICTED: probable dolichyl pyrophosphate Man9GlcNAc2 alpha-1,3-glucosyltransferase [Nicotiana tabacum]